MTRIVDRDLEALRALALRMGSLAESILAKAVQSVWERDGTLAAQVAGDDLAIDRIDVQIDEAVLRVLALQAPRARDLRRVIGTKTLATDLERVGDLSRNIAKSALRLCERQAVNLPASLKTLADDSQRLLRRALDCFSDEDPTRARKVAADDDVIDHEHDSVIRAAIREICEHPDLSSQEVDLILIAKNLERVGDHATNIAEHVVWIAEAENLKHAAKLAGPEQGPGLS